MTTARIPAILVALLMVPAFAATAQSQTSDTDAKGRLVQFPIERYNDTLFTGIDVAARVAFDHRGDVWYTTGGGLVHVDLAGKTREIYTTLEGLPSSFTTAVAVHRGKTYVGTDLGLGVVDIATGRVTTITRGNSQLPDDIVTELALDGDDLWVGTHFHGVVVFNTTRETFTGGKNTSISVHHAQPITRVHPGKDSVWIGTRGDGVWRYDRANGTYEVLLRSDGLLAMDVLSIVERGRNVYFGTDMGLQRWAPEHKGTPQEWLVYNETRGNMPDERVFDLDVLPTEGGAADVFAATRRGLWQLNPETGKSTVRSQSFGILGDLITDNVYSPVHGWAFATSRGISLLRGDNWTYHTTGPTRGVSSGPLSFAFTSASVDNDGRYLWFGTGDGISAYRLSTADRPGKWQNFGPWQNYPGSVVNWIDSEGPITWMGTNQGAYGFDKRDGSWIPMLSKNSRNLVYGLEASGDELWVALFGDGMIAINFTTGIERIFTFESKLFPVPDQLLTDVRIVGDDVWVGSSVGVIRIDRLTGQVKATYGKGDGVPGSGVIFRTLPDGPSVWLGTRDGGVGKLDIASGRVTQVWNSTNIEGFPKGEVRALHREGPRLWVGTDNGLARIDLTTGRSTTFTQQNSGLVQNIVNGITSADGIVYVATLSGISRHDVATETWYALRDGPGIVRGQPGTTAGGISTVSVTIDSPRDGVGVTGVVDVRGSAHAFGSTVDVVEVRIGQGPWQKANGTEAWTYAWDTTGLPRDQPVLVAARARSGDTESRVVEHLVTPVAAPTIPLSVEAIVVENATAFRPLAIAARAQGDEPLAVTAYYRAPGARAFSQMTLVREGSLFRGEIPAREMREGELSYYVRATSGRLEATSPEDATRPIVVRVSAPPRLAVLLEASPNVTAPAGQSTKVLLNVTNAGAETATFGLTLASGLRTSWVSLPAEEIRLEGGQTRTVEATIHVPPAAADANITYTFEARDANGVAEPASVKVPVTVIAAATGAPTTPTKAAPIPMPAALVLIALGAAVVLTRRWRS